MAHASAIERAKGQEKRAKIISAQRKLAYHKATENMSKDEKQNYRAHSDSYFISTFSYDFEQGRLHSSKYEHLLRLINKKLESSDFIHKDDVVKLNKIKGELEYGIRN